MLAVNTEHVLLYWDIGRIINGRQQREGWGAAVIPRLAAELKNELPDLGTCPAGQSRLQLRSGASRRAIRSRAASPERPLHLRLPHLEEIEAELADTVEPEKPTRKKKK